MGMSNFPTLITAMSNDVLAMAVAKQVLTIQQRRYEEDPQRFPQGLTFISDEKFGLHITSSDRIKGPYSTKYRTNSAGGFEVAVNVLLNLTKPRDCEHVENFAHEILAMMQRGIRKWETTDKNGNVRVSMTAYGMEPQPSPTRRQRKRQARAQATATRCRRHDWMGR